MLTQLQDTARRFGYLRPSHVGRHRTAQPLRHGQGRLGRPPSRHAVPGARRRDRRGEDRAAGARARRPDARARDARDRRAGGRRDVGPRPRPPRRRPGQAPRHRSITRSWRGWAIAGSDRLVAPGRPARAGAGTSDSAGRSASAGTSRTPIRAWCGSPSDAGSGAQPGGRHDVAGGGRGTRAGRSGSCAALVECRPRAPDCMARRRPSAADGRMYERQRPAGPRR